VRAPQVVVKEFGAKKVTVFEQSGSEETLVASILLRSSVVRAWLGCRPRARGAASPAPSGAPICARVSARLRVLWLMHAKRTPPPLPPFAPPLPQVSVINDLERACEDGLACVQHMCSAGGQFVPGAGAAEMEVATQLRKLADETDSLDQYAIRKVTGPQHAKGLQTHARGTQRTWKGARGGTEARALKHRAPRSRLTRGTEGVGGILLSGGAVPPPPQHPPPPRTVCHSLKKKRGNKQVLPTHSNGTHRWFCPGQETCSRWLSLAAVLPGPARPLRQVSTRQPCAV